jgi:hypothetical protein
VATSTSRGTDRSLFVTWIGTAVIRNFTLYLLNKYSSLKLGARLELVSLFWYLDSLVLPLFQLIKLILTFLNQAKYSLTKFLEKNINNYDTLYITYENIFNGGSNYINLVFCMLRLFSKSLVKLYMI